MLPSPPETRASLLLRLPDAADVEAWDEVIAIYGPLVFRLARRRGLQPADADDLVQEVFSAVARQIDSWLKRPERGRFRAWLMQIARNTSINILTRNPTGAKGVGGEQSIEWLAQFIAPSESSQHFDIELQRQVMRWAAEQVREQVHQATWQAFHLTHIEGIPIAEAASRLGMTVGNVYLARSRVMQRLRKVANRIEVPE